MHDIHTYIHFNLKSYYLSKLYPEDDKRSRIMGVILGSIALGVLIGYPFGSFLNDFAGKSTPFYILAVFIFGNFSK